MVLGMVEREGKVRTFVVPDRKAETLNPIMKANVETNSRIISDALPSYVELKEVYNHISIKHTQGDLSPMVINTQTISKVTGAY